MRALLVVNPKATTTSARARDVLAHALASECRLEVAETKARGHATELARSAVADGLDLVVALGGDGTVHEVVNGLLADGPHPDAPALGVVPAGSANVFARALGLPDNPVEATGVLLDALQADRGRTVGLGLAEGRWFTFCAGLGLDADVVRRVEQQRSRGRQATPWLYVRSGLRQFFRSTRRHRPVLRVQWDGAAVERVALALVCNTNPWTYLGPRPLQPCPAASFDTGLDVFGLRRLGTGRTLWHLAQILRREPAPRGRDLVAGHDLARVELTSTVPLPFQLDGEDLGDRSAVTLRSVQGALRVLV